MARSTTRRFAWLAIVLALLALTPLASAIGWDSDDFLVSCGPSFTTKIGVFDHDLSFKGYLDANFVTVGGLDFDASGRLVAVAGAMNEVRVYDSSGARVGGFVNGNLVAAGDLHVATDGTYIVGQGNQFGSQGAKQFTPAGAFLRQYGDGNMARVAIVNGDQLWSGRFDAPAIRRFDLSSATEGKSLTVAGLAGVQSILFDPNTQHVFFGHPNLGRVIEADLWGNFVQSYQGPNQASINGIIVSVEGDVTATVSGGRFWKWHRDGSFFQSVSAPSELPALDGIVWTGSIPEPAAGFSLLAWCVARTALRVPRK